MIVKTVGVGGDLPDYVAVAAYLYNTGHKMNLIDTSFKFIQISDITQANANVEYPAASAATHIEIDGGQYTLNAMGSGIRLQVLDGAEYVSMEVHDVIINMKYSSNVEIAFPKAIYVSGGRGLVVRHNRIYSLVSVSANNNCGIFTTVPTDGVLSIYDNIIAFMGGNGIELSGNATSLYNPVMTIENNSVYCCGTRTGYRGLVSYSTTPAGAKDIRNNFFLRANANTFPDVQLNNDTASIISNCACSYSSWGGMPVGNIRDCIQSVSAASNLVSIDPTNIDFLRPISGSLLRTSGIKPSIATIDGEKKSFGSSYPIGALQNVAIIKSQPTCTVYVPVNSAKAFAIGSKTIDDAGLTKLQITNYKGRSDYQDVLQNGGN